MAIEPKTQAGKALVRKVLASRRMRLYGRAAIEADVVAIETEAVGNRAPSAAELPEEPPKDFGQQIAARV